MLRPLMSRCGGRVVSALALEYVVSITGGATRPARNSLE
jgi:hypothetical protein